MTENTDTISYLAYESAMARMERANKRSFIIILILIFALIATNTGWIIYESQFETVETTIEAEQNGAEVNIVGGGDVSYGAESNDQNTNETT
jgi:abortive infection bacteriophage resistance protein